MMVLGMHRSGTSAVTGALVALGFDVGADPLMEATADNPTGHFEVKRLTGLDDEVLDAVGGRWSAPPAAGPDGVKALADGDLGARARALTDEVFPTGAWVWKDPRAALLLPFWRAVLDPEPVAVVVLRHPLAVARSLAARDGMDVGYGLALWERYTRVLLRDLAGMRALVVDYDATMEHPREFVDRLVEFLGADGLPPTEPDPEAAAESFVGDHRHQVFDDADLAADPAVSAELRALRHLTQDLLGPHEAFPALELGPETPGLQVAFTEHKRLSRHEERVAALEDQVARREATIADLLAEIDRRSAQASDLATDLMTLRDDHAMVQVRLDRLERWLPVRVARRVQRLWRRPSP